VNQPKTKRAAVDAALVGMFRTLEARGVPEHLRGVVDQLDEAEGAVTPFREPPSSPEP